MPAPFWYLFAGTLLNRLGYVVAPFLAMYLVGERGLSVVTAGGVVTAFGAGSLVGQPLGGWLADRVGRKRVLVSGMTASAATYFALGAARPLPVIVACAFVAGLATDAYRPAVAAMVTDLIPPESRQRAFGLLYWAINAGQGIAGVVGGALAARHFGTLFVLDAATCLAFAAVALVALPETLPEARLATVERRRWVWDPKLATLTASGFLIAVVHLQWIVTLPLTMRADGLSAKDFGIVAAVNPIVIIVLQPFLLRWLTFPPPRMYAASGVLTGTGFLLTGFADSVIEYGATVVIWTFGEIVFNLAASVILASLAPAHLRGSYQGVWGMAWGLAFFVAPLTGTAVLQHFGALVLWIACGAIAFHTLGAFKWIGKLSST